MNNTLFYHGRTTDGRRFTMAGSVEGDNLNLGLSLCSKNDQFCKKEGRTKAAGRMLSKDNKVSKDFYTDVFKGIAPDYKPTGFSEKYWVGQEVALFVALAKTYENEESVSMQKEFRMYHHAPKKL